MRKSIWRELLYEEVAKAKWSGCILDIGGSHSSKYHSLLKGVDNIDVANLDNGEDKKYNFNFENKFPIESEKYDGIICLNVLEHIFNYQNFLNESCRVMKKNGTIVLGVPFFIQYHPSPNDYWRYTEPTLYKIFKKAGFNNIEVRVIGTGVFGVVYSALHNAIRFGWLQNIFIFLAKMLDKLVCKIAPQCFFTKKYYPLGFVVVATRDN